MSQYPRRLGEIRKPHESGINRGEDIEEDPDARREFNFDDDRVRREREEKEREEKKEDLDERVERPQPEDQNVKDQPPKKEIPPATRKPRILHREAAYYYPEEERLVDEENLIEPLETRGLLGMGRIDLQREKLLKLDATSDVSSDAYLQKMKSDGLYVEIPPQISIQRLEQRLLREERKEYFKPNSELKHQSNIYAEEITKPVDVAFEDNPSFKTKFVNATVSQRLHKYKSKYYRMDIILGKLILHGHPLFCNEDYMATELKEIYTKYEERTNRRVIPFLARRLKVLHEQKERKIHDRATTKEDFEFLEQTIHETLESLKEEKLQIQNMAKLLYGKWLEIKKRRDEKLYSSTSVKLGVRTYTIGAGREYDFSLTHEEPSKLKRDDKPLPRAENSRRSDIRSTRIFIRVLINGQYVARTKKHYLRFPSFEVDLSEQYQIYLFTLPSKIELQICSGTFRSKTLATLRMPIPGEHVRSITSSSSLIKVLPFSSEHKSTLDASKAEDADKIESARKGKEPVEEEKQGASSEDRLNKPEEEKKAEGVKELGKNIVKGVIIAKAEWKGTGPRMPPSKLENFLEKIEEIPEEQITESLKYSVLHERTKFDVNDPRNELMVRLIKDYKNKYLKELLRKDSLNPLHYIVPSRHKLLIARLSDWDLKQEEIPLLEEEIRNNKKLQNFLEIIEKKHVDLSRDIQLGFKQEKEPVMIGQRKLDLIEILRRRVKEVKSGTVRPQLPYRSVVDEMMLDLRITCFKDCCESCFEQRRRLKPTRKKKKGVVSTTKGECRIRIHLIKGHNIQVRNESAKLQQAIREYEMSDYTGTKQQQYPRGPQGMPQGNMPGYGGQPGSAQPGYGGGYPPQPGYQGPGFPEQPGYNQPGQQPGGYGGYNYPGSAQHIPKGLAKFIPPPQIIRVESYIEVRIVRSNKSFSILRSDVVEGIHPDWNEMLEHSIISIGENFSEEELKSNTGRLYFNLFDEKKLILEDDMRRVNTISLKIERRFLGSFSIPLLTIFQNPPRMEAMFKVNRPLFLFGYYTSTENVFTLGGQQLPEDKEAALANIPTYVSVSISLEPLLELPIKNEFEYYRGYEETHLLISGTRWVKKFKNDIKYKERVIRLFGENIQGQSVFLPRYLISQEPPRELIDFNVVEDFAIEKAVRFVSLVPFIEDMQMFDDLPDIWCTSQEFLDLGGGDYEEHAILLCNYFNYIDQKQGRNDIESGIVIGKGVPEGDTVYVIRRHKKRNHIELWNSIRGEGYFFGPEKNDIKCLCIPIKRGYKLSIRNHDPTCQLKNIGCIVTSTNVYVNIQETGDPSIMNFQLENKGCWKPFLSEKGRNKYFPKEKKGLETIQPPLYYSSTSPEAGQQLELKIENEIAKNFEKARSTFEKGRRPMRTKWNRHISQQIRNTLLRLEEYKFQVRNGASNSSLRLNEKIPKDQAEKLIQNIDKRVTHMPTTVKNDILAEISGGRDVFGFPINMTYTSIDLLWEEVKNTDLYNMADDDAEFTLSVAVFSYTSNIFSVWIYIAALIRSRDSIF